MKNIVFDIYIIKRTKAPYSVMNLAKQTESIHLSLNSYDLIERLFLEMRYNNCFLDKFKINKMKMTKRKVKTHLKG
jgi:hypothetical protein